MDMLFKFQYDNTLRVRREHKKSYIKKFKFQYDNTLRFLGYEYWKSEKTFKFQYDNTLRGFKCYVATHNDKFKFQYDNTLSRDYKSHSNIILFLLSFVNMSFLLKNKKSLIFQ